MTGVCSAVAMLAPCAVHAQQRPADDTTGSEILVLGDRADGYGVDKITTATRTGTALIDIPQSIQVVTRDVIDDQQLVDLTSVLRNVSGVQAGTNAGNRSESFTIRGFRSSYYAIDSVVLSPAIETNDSYRDLANVERIEVLKGPASVLYGRGDPGGLINIVTKQPRFTPGMQASMLVGLNQFVRGEADITGPIDAAHTLAYRIIGAAQTGDTFRDVFVPYRRQFLSGSLLWTPGSRTRAIASLTYTHQENQTDRGIVASPDGNGGYVVDLARDRYLGERFAVTASSRYEFNYRIEHDLTDWLTVRQIGHYDNGALDLLGINYGTTVAVNARTGARTVTRAAVEQHEKNHNYDFQADLIAKFATGGIGHTVVFGGERVDGYRFRTFFRGTLAAINIDTPVYGATPGAFVKAADRQVDATSWSSYLQDQVDLGEHLDLLAGIRFDKAKQSDAGASVIRTNDTAWSPRVGLVWKPIGDLALFADYTRSFQAQAAPTFTGIPIEPERGVQYEAGVKAELFGGKLATTAAVYQLTRSHVAQTDAVNIGFNIDAGVQRSRGVEFDATGAIVPGVKLIASGAYIDAEVRRSTDYATGNRLISVPTWSGSLWLTIEPGSGAFKGVGLGGGVFAASNRKGDLENSFSLGGYTRVDASLWYRVSDKLRLTVSGRNLFDTYYVESAVSRAQITPGEGRGLLVGIGTKL